MFPPKQDKKNLDLLHNHLWLVEVRQSLYIVLILI